MTDSNTAKLWAEEFLKELITTNDVSNMLIDADHFAYQGFDPVETLAKLVVYRDQTSTSVQNFKEDLGSLISIGLMRGNVKAKALQKMSPEGVKRFNALKDKYKIQINVKENSGSSTITIPRVINALPLLASRINASRNLARDFNGPYMSSSLPLCMKHTGFGALIPRRHKVGLFIAAVYFSHSLDLHCVVRNIEAIDDDAYSVQFNYYKNSLDSKMYTEDERKKIVKSLNLGTADVYREFLSIFEHLETLNCLMSGVTKVPLEEYMAFFQENTSAVSRTRQIGGA